MTRTRMKPHWIMALGGLTFLSACTTVFHSATQEVRIVPVYASGAREQPIRVQVDSPTGTYHLNIPANFDVEPDLWQTVVVKVEEPCYQPAQVRLRRSITPLYWANAVGLPVGVGLFAFAGDTLSGTLWRYDANMSIPISPVDDYPACMQRQASTPVNVQMPTY